MEEIWNRAYRSNTKILLVFVCGLLACYAESLQASDVLTLKQRKEIFGTNRSDQLPPIEFVNVQRINLANARTFRSLPANVLKYKLTLKGENIVLTLRQNKDLITPGCVVHHHLVKGNKVIYPCAKRSANCFYQGRSDTHRHSWAAVNTCHGLNGVISIRNQTLAIAPLNRKRVSNFDNYNATHVVYPYASEKAVCKTKDYLAGLKLESTGRTRRNIDQKRYIETSVVIDPSVNDFYGYQAEEFVQTTFNVASKLYEDQSLGEDIKLCLSELHIYESYNNISVQFTLDAQQILNDFCSWHSTVTATNPDCTILYTRLDIEYLDDITDVGLSNPSAMCQRGRNCVVVQDVGPASGITIAHEVGHLLGMIHDNDTECRGSQGIMAVGATGEAAFRWSNCSAKALTAFLGTSGAACLSNQPKGLVSRLGYNRNAPLPGTLLARHVQCQLLHGNQALQCDVSDLDPQYLCTNLYCKKNSTAPCSLGSQVLDGTDCNNTRMWCMSAKCIAMDTNNSVAHIDGAWADWDSSYSPCTRTCGGGVKLRRRTCTNPSPQFGGKPCIGSDLKAKLCNMQACTKDYKEEQCSQLDQVYNTSKYGHWVPILGTTGDESCIRNCETDKGYRTPDRKPFWTGTECEHGRGVPFARCFDGKCKKFGCDGVMDSVMMYDNCGVCNGTGADCVPVFGRYNKNNDAKPVLVHGQKVFNTNPSHLSMSGTYNVGGVKIHYARHAGKPELVEIDGPTVADVEIQVYQWYWLSPEVDYAYFRRKTEHGTQYRWLKRYTGCTKSCGTGYQEPIVRCVDLSSSPVEDYLCDISRKPTEIRRPCNAHFCPPEWKTSHLGPCSKSCGPGGIRQRQVHCVRENHGTELILNSGCDQAIRPPSVINCTLVSCPGYWKTGLWSHCSKTCSEGMRRRRVFCTTENGSLIEERFCSRGTMPTQVESCFTQFCPGTPNGTDCSNLKAACKQNYGEGICYGNYSAWAEQHCMKECGVCTSDDDPRCKLIAEKGDNPCEKYKQWAAKNCRKLCSGCVDEPQCQELVVDKRVDVCRFTAFAMKTCPSMCGFCGPCEDKAPTQCRQYDKSYCYTNYMKKMCRKHCGLCRH